MPAPPLQSPAPHCGPIGPEGMQSQRLGGAEGVRRRWLNRQHPLPQGGDGFREMMAVMAPRFPWFPGTLQPARTTLQVGAIQLTDSPSAYPQLLGHLPRASLSASQAPHQVSDVPGSMASNQLHVVFFMPYATPISLVLISRKVCRTPGGKFAAHKWKVWRTPGRFAAQAESLPAPRQQESERR